MALPSTVIPDVSGRTVHVHPEKKHPSQATTNRDLSTNKKRRLVRAVKAFEIWLREAKGLQIDTTQTYDLMFPTPTSSDWIMQVIGTELQFNTHVLNRCSFEFFQLILLHECFHLFVQNVPNKSDAKRLKDAFGDRFMKLLDIEADLYTAMYYKDIERVSLVDLFALLHEGSKVFGDPDIRAPKLERFMGSVLSIADTYLGDAGSTKTLYLPDISNVSLEEKLHILCLNRDHSVFKEIPMDFYHFNTIKACYTGVNGASVKFYVETLLNFASKALRTNIPASMYEELNAL